MPNAKSASGGRAPWAKEEAMKKWQRTIISWWYIDKGETNIPVAGRHTSEKQSFHDLGKLRISSLPGNEGIVELQISRESFYPESDARAVIVERLTSLGTRGRMVSLNHTECSVQFTLTFALQKGEKFCDGAITVAKDIFDVLGIQDGKLLRISSFYTRQETLVFHNRRWIPFADYLRFKHNLNPDGALNAAFGLKKELLKTANNLFHF